MASPADKADATSATGDAIGDRGRSPASGVVGSKSATGVSLLALPGELTSSQMTRNSPDLNEAWLAFLEEEGEYVHGSSRFVLYRDSTLRSIWSMIVALLLVYTGTIFMYRLCFVELRIVVGSETIKEADGGWATWDDIVNVLFWIDLFANFFFTAEGANGKEVVSLPGIAKAYLQGAFVINLLACIPAGWVEEVTYQLFPGSDFNQSLRTLRLQRVSRLAKLVRLSRLGKLRAYRDNPWYIWLQENKGVRIVNLGCGLLFAIHIFACGWYLCAALHDEPGLTWVGSRTVDAADEVSLLQSPPFDQWLHAMYFIFVVFSTVGFGDMSASTTGEIIYVCIVMCFGAVVHSIIISEVINVVQSADERADFVQMNVDLIDAFAEHTELEEDTQNEFRTWLQNNASSWMRNQYDKDKMRELITGNYLPRELLGTMPEALFDGKLIGNRIFSGCMVLNAVPPRLPTLLAISCQQLACQEHELIYKVSDFPFNLFLVLSGTFAYVAYPAAGGGLPASESSMDARLQVKAKGHQKPGSDLVAGQPTHKGLSSILRGTQATEVECQIDEVEVGLFPYKLFSHSSYFGDLELFQNCARHTTARCESKTGDLLSLRKKDLVCLTEEFPQFGVLGKITALSRASFRQLKQKALTTGLNYKDFAATTIQRAIRKRAALPGKGMAKIASRADAAAVAGSRANQGLALGKAIHGGGRDLNAEVQKLQGTVDGMSAQIEQILMRFSQQLTVNC